MILLVGIGTAAIFSAVLAAMLFQLLRARKSHSLRPKVIVSILLISCLTIGTVTSLYFVGFLGENFRAVHDKQCYRSAALAPEVLKHRIKTYGIKTVVNLRGTSRQPWYIAQQDLMDKLSIGQENIKLDTQDLPIPENLNALIRVLHTSPRPILFHCNHGIDRTGIAAVLYKTIVDQEPLDAAINSEQSIYSGHIATSNNDAGDRFFELYESDSSQLSLENWIRDKYPSRYAEAIRLEEIESKVEWYNAPFRLGPLTITPFKCLGICGAMLFACRWFVQAYYSRRAGRPVTPLNFWLMSILGSLLMLFYFMFSAKQDIVGIISNFFPAVVAAYNVFLELRHRARERSNPMQHLDPATPPLPR